MVQFNKTTMSEDIKLGANGVMNFYIDTFERLLADNNYNEPTYFSICAFLEMRAKMNEHSCSDLCDAYNNLFAHYMCCADEDLQGKDKEIFNVFMLN